MSIDIARQRLHSLGIAKISPLLPHQCFLNEEQRELAYQLGLAVDCDDVFSQVCLT